MADQKNEAVLLIGERRTKLDVRFKLRHHEVKPGPSLKYLGIHIDTDKSCSTHVTKTCKKAERTVALLARLMPNVRGPRYSKRQVLASVIMSVILYGVDLWKQALDLNKNVSRLTALQRRISLRIISGYRTI